MWIYKVRNSSCSLDSTTASPSLLTKGFIRSEVERNPLASEDDLRVNMQIFTASAKFIISKSSYHLHEKVCALLLKSYTTAKLTTYELTLKASYKNQILGYSRTMKSGSTNLLVVLRMKYVTWSFGFLVFHLLSSSNTVTVDVPFSNFLYYISYTMR